MKAPFQLGAVGHFGLAVHDPRLTADWYVANLGMSEAFEFDCGVAVESDGVTLVLSKGTPSPKIGNVSFRLADMETLRACRPFLREWHVDLTQATNSARKSPAFES